MTKVFRYELKRLLPGRVFLILLICNCIYAAAWLLDAGISGIGGTAPFSAWTYLTYCGTLLPPALVTVLLLQAEHFSRKQQQTDLLLLASPVSPGTLHLLRCGALAVCFLILFVLEFTLYVVFCTVLFGESGVLVYILYSLLPAAACFLLAAGLGALLGSIRGWLIYVLAVCFFVIGLIRLNTPLDLFCGGFFEQYPLTLTPDADGEPSFRIVPLWLAARFVFLAAGIVLLMIDARRRQKSDRA